MNRRIVATSTTIAALVLGTVMATDASAGTPSWLKVRTASHATAYNGKKVTVAPKAGATGQRVITSLRIAAYRGKKRVSSGRTAHLKPGTYKTITTGTYRSYRLVNQTRTRSVLHAGDYTSATCRVTSVSDDGFGDTTSQATCTNPYYPRQRKTDEEFDTYQVGQTYPYSFFFDDEYVTQHYVAKVRSYGASHTFSSSKRTLSVRDGGYRKVFTGSGNLDTGNFRSPGKNWRVSYSYDCSDYANFSIVVKRANGDYVDLAANDLGSSGSGSAREQGSGKFYLEVEMTDSCSWRVKIK